MQSSVAMSVCRTIWLYVYHTLSTMAVILGSPWILWAVLFSEKRRKSILYRSGFRLPDLQKIANYPPKQRKPVWIHALSVGETWSAVPFAISMKTGITDRPVVFSSSTLTGFELAKHHLNDILDAVFYFPYDLQWSLWRIISQVNPCVVAVVETDIWPGFLNAMHHRNIPVFWVNARLSEKSFTGYNRFRFLFRPLFNEFSAICVQTRRDLNRFLQMGVDSGRLTVMGNFKFDQLTPGIDASLEKLTRILLPGSDTKILIGGSTHDGEETILLAACNAIRQTVPAFRLILAPRDPNRSKDISRLAADAGLSVRMLTEMMTSAIEPPHVIIVDRIGLLRSLYALADVAVIGGSLMDFGGHNPLEPAFYATPVLFGPHMQDFEEIARTLLQSDAAIRVENGSDLTEAVLGLLHSPQKAKEMGRRAQDVMKSHQGAIKKTIERIRKTL
jgi:3-deoxy-D-manno-octulosonic-acid transferase